MSFEPGEGAFADWMVEIGRDAQVLGFVLDPRELLAAGAEHGDAQVKGEATPARCSSMLAWRTVARGLLVATPLALVPASAGASSRTLRQRAQEPVEPANDHVVLMPMWNSGAFGVGLAYERAVGRRVSVGAGFDYLAQPVGVTHLQGFQETLSVSVWPQRAFSGFVARPQLGLGHQVFASAPRLSTNAVLPGGEIGWVFRLPRRVTAGVTAAMRWGKRIVDPKALCTRPDLCPAVREGVQGRFALTVGYAF